MYIHLLGIDLVKLYKINSLVPDSGSVKFCF